MKSTAYTTMVRPRLEYSSTVWYPHHYRDIHNLEQVQCRAARFVNRNYTERTPGCVTNMIQSLGWESLQHRRYINRFTMLFKIEHCIIDISPDFVQLNANIPEDPSVYASYRPQTTYTSSPFILGPSATGTGCHRTSPTSRALRDSGMP